MNFKLRRMAGVGALVALSAAIGAGIASVAQEHKGLGYQDTPMLPGGKWHVHDGNRPQPKVIEPGTFSSQEMPGKPPSDAIVLFDGTNLDHWKDGNGPAKWKVENGYMEVTPKTGSISSVDQLGDCQLHIEWREPRRLPGNGQERGNSGVIFFGRYEVQVLDSYDNPTYADGSAASIYGSWPPLVNAMRKPGEWQMYDILFTVPRFEAGKLVKPGYFTVFHNGVAVHHHVELLGNSNHRQLPNYEPHPLRGSLVLQNHGNPVQFRNIWYRDVSEYDEKLP
jgi:Domain of Unknown Function (DUF1080)